MSPVSFAPGNAYGFIPIIIPTANDHFYNFSLGNLTVSELEAVDRMRDQFHSRAELEAFIKGLRR